jgi:translocator protein
MRMNRAVLWSFGICMTAAALEGLFAGGGVRQRLAEVRMPRFAIPFWGWVVIGVFYYAICFAISYRLLTEGGPMRNAALLLLSVCLFTNALWNYFFFRTRNLFHVFVLGVCYSAIALGLFLILLLRVDRMSAAVFAPYLLYLIFANYWGYSIWRLNTTCVESGE